LSLISKGKANSSNFIGEMRNYASKLVSTIISSSETYKHDNITKEKCPECGKYLLEVNGKKGKMLVCADRECGFRKTVTQISNARCPECHKKMEIRGEGENKTFFCNCGYREKLEAFKERKSEQVSKREVNKFLRQQDTSELSNTSLAEALAKWKTKA
ncbi:MAG TPA: DNA topoisomerase III, partial [Clostridiales bacterium]|nr:DNA topoisomerase III [Clostridiales bacterium]